MILALAFLACVTFLSVAAGLGVHFLVLAAASREAAAFRRAHRVPPSPPVVIAQRRTGQERTLLMLDIEREFAWERNRWAKKHGQQKRQP